MDGIQPTMFYELLDLAEVTCGLGVSICKPLRKFVPLRLKIAQKPCIVWSLGPKASYFESLEP